MTEYYVVRAEKQDSPTKRLVAQKDATVKMKTNNPDSRDTQLYLTDGNLKKTKTLRAE